MAANYDRTAWFYDSLSKLIFGRSIIRAQVSLLKYIPANSSILIIGGGTGWILEEIAKVYANGLKISYVEVSAKMIALSQKRNYGNNHVDFVNAEIEKVSLQAVDVVITPFLFDNFTPAQLPALFEHIHKQLKPRGTWLNADFRIAGRWWHKPLLKSMYLFFKIFSAVENDQLSDIMPLFEKYGYRTLSNATFYGDFMMATAMEKL